MEVRTILNFLKQKVNIPVPGGGGRLAGLQGFLPGQSSTVPSVEQNADIPVPGGGQQGLRPGQGSAASSSSSHFPAGVLEDADEPVEWFFALFPAQKKCEGRCALECECARALQPIRAERSSNGSSPG